MDQLIGESLPPPTGDLQITQDGHIWFDAPHNRVALKIMQEDYDTKTQTTILPAQKKCTTKPTATVKIHQCLNETNPTFVKALNLGGSLDAYMWKSKVDNDQQHLEVTLTISQDSCLPIANVYSGTVESKGEQIPIQGSMLYFDITPGLKDTGIFKIPSYCTESSSIGNEDIAFQGERSPGLLF
ncbi:unnamed protein product [Owenia fusiformis]|uniref:Uncharacterized protein n=1 Tax=Owenia fusiformis TaxID=6347 RepID=A0A8S4N6B0_OWEFU|nr:unnamed protein product [Owenia fusiformis]